MGAFTNAADSSIRKRAVGAGTYPLSPDDKLAAENADLIRELNAVLSVRTDEAGSPDAYGEHMSSFRAFRFYPTRIDQIDGFIIALTEIRLNSREEDKALHQTGSAPTTFFVGRDHSVFVRDEQSGWLELQSKAKPRAEPPKTPAELIITEKAAEIAAIGAKIPAPAARAAFAARP